MEEETAQTPRLRLLEKRVIKMTIRSSLSQLCEWQPENVSIQVINMRHSKSSRYDIFNLNWQVQLQIV